LALATVLATRLIFGEVQLRAWGWRIPFLLSALLLALALWIRASLAESPVFQHMKEARLVSRSPISEAFRGDNLRRILLALVCILLAQGAVWYTAHFYAQFFLERVLKVDALTVNVLVMLGVLISCAGYVVFGWLSDRVGRKPVMLCGMILAAAAYLPGFHYLAAYANPGLQLASERAPITIIADPADCHFQFDPFGRETFDSSCDLARRILSDTGVPYHNVSGEKDVVARVAVAGMLVPSVSVAGLDSVQAAAQRRQVGSELRGALDKAGYPLTADASRINAAAVLAILVVFMLASAALYGPQAAALVELFPTRVRYTALSVPYNIGTGWIGGLLPVSAFAMVAATGDIYFGLAYPLVFTVVGIVATLAFFPETNGRSLVEVEAQPAAEGGYRAV
jgi:MFS family permease